MARYEGDDTTTKKVISVDRKSWSSLTPRERLHRQRSLEVLKEMRRTGNSLKDASLPPGITSEMVVESIGSALRRVGDSWVAREHDNIPRALNIIEKGKLRSIMVNDSWEASKAGKYLYAVGQFRDKGDTSLLEQFKTMHIRDSRGRLHTFETDPEAIREVLKRLKNGKYELYP